jgi:hypothetical protein
MFVRNELRMGFAMNCVVISVFDLRILSCVCVRHDKWSDVLATFARIGTTRRDALWLSWKSGEGAGFFCWILKSSELARAIKKLA